MTPDYSGHGGGDPRNRNASSRLLEAGMEVLLRDVLESDLPVLFEHQLDPMALRMAAFVPRDEQEFLEHWRKNILADQAVSKYTIVFDEQIVGYIVSFERSGLREVGYWIAREHWGQGIATSALVQFLRSMVVRPLYAIVAKHNLASLRVLEKCGFATESQRRGSLDARGLEVDELVLKLGETRP